MGGQHDRAPRGSRPLSARYVEALRRLEGRIGAGIRPGLETTRLLLGRVWNPDRAGTNGKGSTAAMTAGILQQAGYKTGLFISPFLEDFRERIQINRELISREHLARYTQKVKGCIDRLTAGGGPAPAEFEIVFAIAALYFFDMACDIVVLEVGLGGRFDATNAIGVPLAAVITSISYDHMDLLGHTLTQIAREKCGIIKPGGTAVVSPGQQPEAMEAITADCGEKGARLIRPDLGCLSVIGEDITGSRFIYRNLKLDLPLIGHHQIGNALTALETVFVLRDAGYRISDEDIQTAIAQVRWAGRMEKIKDNPLCFLDGAHNIDAMQALTRLIETQLGGRKLIAVMGMMKSKDYAACVPLMAKHCAIFIATQPPLPGALPADEAGALAAGCCPAVACRADAREAIALALSSAGKDDVVMVCGSLYLIGQARMIFREDF